MQQRADGLLPEVRAEGGDGCARRSVAVLAAIRGRGRGGGGGCLVSGDVLLDDVAVPFLDGAAEELEGHDEEDDADAGAGEHTLAGDAPGRGDEAGVDGVPVPQHLE